VSVDAHLLHRCTIRRPKKVVDVYRNDTVTMEIAETDVPCRLVIKRQNQFSSELAQFVAVTNYLLLLGAGTDVREGDEIADLVYEDRSEVAEVFAVAAILPRRARTVRHITLLMERVS
jgi:hypothetical protein